MNDGNLQRVASKIEDLIVTYCAKNRVFRMEELTNYVKLYVPHLAPDSPGRILRLLRRQGTIHYDVLSRRQSVYAVRFTERQGRLF